jgi:hypothetical protein
MKKLLVILFTSFLLPLHSFSQVIEWQNTIGGDLEDRIISITQSSDGGFALGGISNSNISGDKTENSNGGFDYWIVKTDSIGVIQWQNTIGGSDGDYLYSIAQTTDGGYILGGSSESNISGDKTENSNGGIDYWIVKIDSTGAIQWQNTIGGSGDDELCSIVESFDGGFILGGHSQSNISGDKTENNNGFADYWIVKIDSTGAIQWQNNIGGDNYDWLCSTLQTNDAGYILGGDSHSDISGDKIEMSNGSSDFWVVKTDSLGVVQWQNTIGGGNFEYLNSISQMPDGGYTLGGFSDSDISGDKTENSRGGLDYWIVKIDSVGVVLWESTFGGNYWDRLRSIARTSDGGNISVGDSYSTVSGDKTENSMSYDFWVVKTNETGYIQWQNTIGGSAGDVPFCVKQTSEGGYVLGGYSGSNISGDKTENCIGQGDFWIVKITDKFNLINGKVFIDANNNGYQDIGETSLINQKIAESGTGNFSFSQQNGIYYVPVIGPGIYSVSSDLVNYYNAVPASHSATFTGIHQTDSLNDFALQPAGVFNDLCVSITPLGPFRSGFNASYLVNYSNVGTTTLNPTVIFFPDNNVSFVNATPVASSVTLDSTVWNFGPLAPFQSGQIVITVNVNIGMPIGTLINSGVRIEPLAGDANLQCNQSYWEEYTTGSYDPNDILVDEDTLLSTQFPNPPFLEYLIRFQNTGNDTAFTVKILNLIDTTLLDLSSFEFVTSSHPVNLSWLPWERNMQFMFNNILLPDSNANEPESHGFVRYRIQPKSNLGAGDAITNNAAIYFDFNNPILTNIAFTQIVLPTSIQEISSTGNLLIYPNPANSSLTIETSTLMASGSKLTVSDVAGRTLLSKTIDGNVTKHQIDISSFSSGIYFVQIDGGKGIARGRFVKE